jgi:hypothetical protein
MWQTRYFLLFKMLFSTNMAVLRGIYGAVFGELLYITQNAFVP